MQVIGVVDLLAGRAVHACAGRREKYQPVQSVAGIPIEPGDAIWLARRYLQDLGITSLYAADLDAILNQPPGMKAAAPAELQANHRLPRFSAHPTIVRELVALGVPVWLDAGIQSVDDARDAHEMGVARVVVGLETLPSYEALEDICTTLGTDRVVFSLDLRDGRPITSLKLGADSASQIAVCVTAAGVEAMIVLDLARVGTGAGPDFELIANIRMATPDAMLVAGGGIRGPQDLTRLADIGCDGALVATALLEGQLTAADVLAARNNYNPTR